MFLISNGLYLILYRTHVKINKEAVVQVVLQRMWFDTTNSYNI